jgi:hypothetical protein
MNVHKIVHKGAIIKAIERETEKLRLDVAVAPGVFFRMR